MIDKDMLLLEAVAQCGECYASALLKAGGGRLRYGRIYSRLLRLEKAGLASSRPEGRAQAAAAGQELPRLLFRITEKGWRVLEDTSEGAGALPRATR